MTAILAELSGLLEIFAFAGFSEILWELSVLFGVQASDDPSREGGFSLLQLLTPSGDVTAAPVAGAPVAGVAVIGAASAASRCGVS
ncbi:hypothetical protein [Streptosporangium pseudovulgare]|uniref:hypothetical protein n=1 Tax=Streptosporangium pseudovulgare TaxID=35765 RepID=UPI00167004FF|nr:hypothetical protein [Streptosporangium pseudovulgare]